MRVLYWLQLPRLPWLAKLHEEFAKQKACADTIYGLSHEGIQEKNSKASD